jgi:cation diffusion facilitator CzcD-associated flavoprotein CzcO
MLTPVHSPTETHRRYALIGAGPVGLGIARALKGHNIPYDQFAADDDVGGNRSHGENAHVQGEPPTRPWKRRSSL